MTVGGRRRWWPLFVAMAVAIVAMVASGSSRFDDNDADDAMVDPRDQQPDKTPPHELDLAARVVWLTRELQLEQMRHTRLKTMYDMVDLENDALRARNALLVTELIELRDSEAITFRWEVLDETVEDGHGLTRTSQLLRGADGMLYDAYIVRTMPTGVGQRMAIQVCPRPPTDQIDGPVEGGVS